MFISGKACSVNNLGRKHRGRESDSGSDGNTGMLMRPKRRKRRLRRKCFSASREAVDAISHMPEARGRARLVPERVPTKMQDGDAGEEHGCG